MIDPTKLVLTTALQVRELIDKKLDGLVKANVIAMKGEVERGSHMQVRGTSKPDDPGEAAVLLKGATFAGEMFTVWHRSDEPSHIATDLRSLETMLGIKNDGTPGMAEIFAASILTKQQDVKDNVLKLPLGSDCADPGEAM